MGKRLTDSSLYILNPRRGHFKARCIACLKVTAEGADINDVWRSFRAFSNVIKRGTHELWVCDECYKEDQKGTLLVARLDKYDASTKRQKPKTLS